MNYTRAMPTLQPYPQEAYAANDYAYYRPAYHRLSSPIAAPRQVKTNVSPEVVPVVPSMASPPYIDYYHSHAYASYPRQPFRVAPPPIHHTLENATITYDTVDSRLTKKDLVKDVFFSPAMSTFTREASPASVSSQSDSESESDVATPPRDMTPSDLLLDDPLYVFDLELDLFGCKKKPALMLQKAHSVNMTDLPTPAEIVEDQCEPGKRRRHSVTLTPSPPKKCKQDAYFSTTPPASPEHRELFDMCFDDASAGAVSDDEDEDSDSLSPGNGFTRFGNSQCQRPSTEFQPFDAWEVPQDTMFDQDTDSEHSECEEDEQSQSNKTLPAGPCQDHPEEEVSLGAAVAPRPTAHPTIYQKLTDANVDWCRYCGTTEGVNWRPGPWGKRTLCNKHGCDYKGYGFACKLPRLDLTGFVKESIDSRDRPVLQLFCSGCQRQESWENNVLVRCEGCPKAFHQKCCSEPISDDLTNSDKPWFCNASCCENARRKRIVVELPRKRLPLMCSPKANVTASESSRPSRFMRESK